MKLLKILYSLVKHKAKKQQYYLEIGAYFLKKGAGFKPGDPFMVPIKRKGQTKHQKVWITNLFFDFAHNKINHQFTSKDPNKKC